MKKATVILLATVYLVMTSGFMVNIHFCMGEFASLKYGHEPDAPCDTCGMEDQTGCCHTEHKLLKADDDHTITREFVEISSFPAEIPFFYLSDLASDLRTQEFIQPPCNSPPDPRNNELRIYNGVFRV